MIRKRTKCRASSTCTDRLAAAQPLPDIVRFAANFLQHAPGRSVPRETLELALNWDELDRDQPRQELPNGRARFYTVRARRSVVCCDWRPLQFFSCWQRC